VELLRDTNPEQEELPEQASVDKLPSMTCTHQAQCCRPRLWPAQFPVMVEQLLISFASSWEAMVAEEQDVAAATMSF
jgi:hypothetical protein